MTFLLVNNSQDILFEAEVSKFVTRLVRHYDQHERESPFRSKRLRTVGQLPPEDKRRRLLDLGVRVTVYNPLTAWSYWRMAAVLAELRHDAAIGLPGTQRRVAGDAPPYLSHKFNGAWGLSWGFRRGARESKRSAGVSLLISSRWFRRDISDKNVVHSSL